MLDLSPHQGKIFLHMNIYIFFFLLRSLTYVTLIHVVVVVELLKQKP